MGLKEVYVLVFMLEGREQVFKAYANGTAKTGRRAKKHARIKTKQYGTLFTARIMTLEGEDNQDGTERTDNTIQKEGIQNDNNKTKGQREVIDLPGGGGGGLFLGVGRTGDQSYIERIERLKRPTFTEENYKAGLIGITPENLKEFDEARGLPTRTEEEYEKRAADIISGTVHPFPVSEESNG